VRVGDQDGQPGGPTYWAGSAASPAGSKSRANQAPPGPLQTLRRTVWCNTVTISDDPGGVSSGT